MRKSNLVNTQDDPERRSTVQKPLLHRITRFSSKDMIIPISRRSTESVDPYGLHFPTWLTGEWGMWQLRTVVLVYLLKLPAAWCMACLIFTAPFPKPGDVACDVDTVLSNHGFSKDIPHSHPSILQSDGSYWDDHCIVIVHDKDGSEQRFTCTKFIPSAKEITSLVTQYKLYCSQKILISITQCFHLFGILVGGIIQAELIKSISPKRTVLIGLGLQIILGVVTGFPVHFWLHTILRSMLAMTVPICIASGQMISWFSSDSPSWYLGKENPIAAKILILSGHSANKFHTPIPDSLDEILRRRTISIHYARTKDRSSSWKELLALEGSKWRLACLGCTWSLMYICYFGTLLNIRSFKSGDVYYSTPIAGVCELIGGFVGFVIIMKCKKKWAVSGTLTFMSGIFPCIIWLLPTNADGSHKYLHLMILQMINKIGINIILCVAFTCSPEIFPSMHKRRAMYGITVFTRVLFISAPMIGYLAVYGDGISLTAFGVLSMICGLSIVNMSPIPEEKSTMTDLPTDRSKI